MNNALMSFYRGGLVGALILGLAATIYLAVIGNFGAVAFFVVIMVFGVAVMVLTDRNKKTEA